jgi:hypothetical protein
MSSEPKENENGRSHTFAERTEMEETPIVNAAREEDIRRRAYEIYLECGGQRGRELDDWLRAERELET